VAAQEEEIENKNRQSKRIVLGRPGYVAKILSLKFGRRELRHSNRTTKYFRAIGNLEAVTINHCDRAVPADHQIAVVHVPITCPAA
jgi:hypothetical protein